MSSSSNVDKAALVVAGFALLVSGYTACEQNKLQATGLTLQQKLQHEVETQTLIHDQYELCRDLDKIRVEQPQISHLLALPTKAGVSEWANYDLFRANVKAIVSKNRPPTKSDGGASDEWLAAAATLYLQEHAVALHVFDIYEQTLLQFGAAESAQDKERTKVLRDLLDYYEQKLLRNPRLRYHWSHGGEDLMDPSTKTRYAANVVAAFPKDPTDALSVFDP